MIDKTDYYQEKLNFFNSTLNIISNVEKFKSMQSFYCCKCGKTFQTSLDDIIDKKGKCPKCTKITKQLSVFDISHRIHNLNNNLYLLKIYENTSKDYLTIGCSICHTEFKRTLQNYKAHPTCPICAKKKRKIHPTKYKKGQNKGELNGNYKRPKLKGSCSNCGKPVERDGLYKAKKYFCDAKCKAEWQSKNAPPAELNSFNIYKEKIKQIKLEKYGNENYNNVPKNRESKIQNGTISFSHYKSKIATSFFNELESILPKGYKYYYDDKEFFLWSKDKEHLYFYDFECREQKKIIEFNGDYFHCNPNKYKENETVKMFGSIRNVKDIWEHDKQKNQVAIDKGFEVLTIWEGDVRKNKQAVLNRCFEYIFDNEIRL